MTDKKKKEEIFQPVKDALIEAEKLLGGADLSIAFIGSFSLISIDGIVDPIRFCFGPKAILEIELKHLLKSIQKKRSYLL